MFASANDSDVYSQYVSQDPASVCS